MSEKNPTAFLQGGKPIEESDLQNFVAVGKVRDGHGLKGELFLVFYAREAPWMEQTSELMLVQNVWHKDQEKELKYVFRFPRGRTKPHKIGVIVQVAGIVNRTHADFFKGAVLYVPSALLTSRPGEMIYLREVLGFEVVHEERGGVGRVSDFSSNGSQDLLVIQTLDKTKQFEVPFVEDFVGKVDWEKKQLQMSFPAELADTLVDIPTPKRSKPTTDT